MHIALRLLILVALWLQVGEAAKILVFIPFPMKSHHFAFQPIVRELAERGHQVTYLTAVPMEKPLPKSLRQILVPNVLNTLQHDVLPGFVSFGKMSTPTMSLYFGKAGRTIMDATLGTPEAQKIIHSDEKFDLVIHEAFFVSEPVVALQHKFNAPGVALMPLADSSWLHEMSGLTDNPAYMIDFKTDFTDRLTFFQRVHNLYHLVATLIVSYADLYLMQGLMDKHFNYTGWENRPSIVRLLGDQALILVNSHHSVGYNFPRAPHVKEVGGINLRPTKPLPQDLELLLNDSPEGVIYFSLGSNIDMSQVSSKGIRDAFSNVFAKLKQRVLWKWTGKDFPPVPSNVYMSDWFPQQDILVHKNVKLFITHGGLLSITEAVNSAVPLIGIPFFSDQRKNLKQITTAGFGLGLEFENLTESSISWAVNEVLNNERYKKQALIQQSIFRDRPMKPVEESVYWIEYVLRHGKALQPASVHMPLYQLLLLDVLGVIAAGVLLVIVITKKLFGVVLSCLRSNKPKKLKQK
uniref:UDP-glucuronosyltransferase n=1 Tax=Lygus hesperus TaxID=30085 RepID=A0A0K8T7V1_LYGHE